MQLDDKRDRNIFDMFDQESPIATEMRRLYSNIQTNPSNNSIGGLMVTSANRGEGKSTVASHLALTVARFKEKKSLIIDADLRKPKIHQIFNVAKEPGLAECLKDNIDPLKVIKDTRIDNLKVLPSGGLVKSPSHLFEKERLRDIFEKIKFYYDIVIVDTPPVIPVSDPMLISGAVDKVIMVVLAGKTPQKVTIRARDILLDADANLIGIVVNNLSEVLPYYYDYKYYGYEHDLENQ
jgi:capsular exopolysaccharide synthesis family protein